MEPSRPEPYVPGLRELFLGFGAAGIMGFGGVLPWVRRMIVEQRRWLTAAEFNDVLALCQFLPGPNVVNLSVALGSRYHGLPGAFASIGGLLLAPVVIAMGLGALYARYGGLPVVQDAFAGLAAAAAGLVVATAAKIAWPLARHPISVGVAVLSCVLIALVRLPLLPTMLALVPLSILLHHYADHRR